MSDVAGQIEPLTVEGVAWLEAIHVSRGLQLTTVAGMSGHIQLCGSPAHMVSELLRLARIAAELEAAPSEGPHP